MLTLAADRLGAPSNSTFDRILSVPDLLALLGLGRTAAYSAQGPLKNIPAIRLSARRVGYRHSDVQAWLARRSTKPGPDPLPSRTPHR